MSEKHLTAKELGKGAEGLVIHIFAIVAGLVLMVVGLAMGVSIVLLPLGIPLGLAGLAVFAWGFFGRAEQLPPGPELGP
jgi:hypothetical protein